MKAVVVPVVDIETARGGHEVTLGRATTAALDAAADIGLSTPGEPVYVLPLIGTVLTQPDSARFDLIAQAAVQYFDRARNGRPAGTLAVLHAEPEPGHGGTYTEDHDLSRVVWWLADNYPAAHTDIIVATPANWFARNRMKGVLRRCIKEQNRRSHAMNGERMRVQVSCLKVDVPKPGR